jgi:hypothetical protein
MIKSLLRFTLKRLLIATGWFAALVGCFVWCLDQVKDAQLSAVRDAYDYDRLSREEARYYVGDIVDSWPEPKSH